ncbi:MAG: succinate dehydrogenase, cytochrome b556 subunit [Gammaproteobacteria bacterium]|nr:succinate dehydrogenase, cytochrome b556 subunit [Gammaproteobacteria bacterium]MCP5136102.1 succinate dehydrogenase, cytochrome b556 subunit [Gammaproteobacteria bacterium]
MSRADTRPVYLNLFRIRLPIAGVMSIAHRLSGVLMAFLVPVGLYLLERSLSDAAGFDQVSAVFSGILARVLMLTVLWALLHHLFAGVRYLLLDIDVGVHKPVYRYTAWLVMVAAPVVAVLICMVSRA